MRKSPGDFMQTWIYERVSEDTAPDQANRLAAECEAAALAAGITSEAVLDDVGSDIGTLVREAIVHPN